MVLRHPGEAVTIARAPADGSHEGPHGRNKHSTFLIRTSLGMGIRLTQGLSLVFSWPFKTDELRAV
jgi:hypothetical protein